MKIVFFGSDDFAAGHLKALLKSAHQVCAVVTQPDRAKGRGLKVIYSSIKELALKANIPVYQPADIGHEDITESLKGFNSDLFVVIAYGQFLPSRVLDIPRIFAVNVHASLLPRYRGAAPINWALLNGEKKTGVTIMKINSQMDAGDIITQQSLNISEDDNAVTLREKLMNVGISLLLDNLEVLDKGPIKLKKQDPKLVTHAPKLNKPMGHILWNKKAHEIQNMVRGLLPWPSAYTFYNGKILKILESSVAALPSMCHKAGEVVSLDKDGLLVATSKDGLLIKKVHPESAKPMSAKEFLAGHKITPGFKFD